MTLAAVCPTIVGHPTAEEFLDPIEEVDIRNGAGRDFLARLPGLLCDKGVIDRSDVDELLAELRPPSDPERSKKDRRRILCYISALERLRGHLDLPPPKK